MRKMKLGLHLFTVLFFCSQTGNAKEHPIEKQSVTSKSQVNSLVKSKTNSSKFDVINNPDEFAWNLFIDLSHPVDPKKPGIKDTTKKLGDLGPTVWESWALAQEVFRSDGCMPADWGSLGQDVNVPLKTQSDPGSKAALVFDFAKAAHPSDKARTLFFPPSIGKGDFGETRMNFEAFEFIKEEGLFTIEGQEKFHREGKFIDLPNEAQEIKSSWRRLTNSEANSGQFHTYVVSEKEVYGLTALHIITKDLPQWFWATFEHISNPDVDIRDSINDLRWFDRYTNGGEKNLLPTQIKGTKWEYYRLKGTQTDFTQLDGRPTILANTIIERGFMGTSSCISCHAHATIGAPMPCYDKADGFPQDDVTPFTCTPSKKRANRIPIFEDISFTWLDPTDPKNSKASRFIKGWTGAPDPKRFFFTDPERDADGILSAAKRKYTQTDFMWSFMRAKSEKLCPK